MLLCRKSKAQINVPLNVQFSDSVQLAKGARFASNNIILTNLDKIQKTYTLSFISPNGWRVMSITQGISLKPGEQRVVPLTIVPLPNTRADWTPVEFFINGQTSADTSSHIFWIKAFPVARYEAKLMTREVYLSGKDRRVDMKLYISNNGNIFNKVNVSFRNYFIGFNGQVELALQPNTDTVFTYSFDVPKAKLAELSKQNISVKTTDSAGAVKLQFIELNRLVDSRKQNASAYLTIPFEVENGYVYIGKELRYFAGVKGGFKFNNNTNLVFSYRSKEFGIENQLQNHVLTLDYQSKKFNLFLGQVSGAGHFATFGNGLKSSYQLSNKLTAEVGVSIHKRNSYFKNDNIEVGIKAALKKFKTEHSAAANIDRITLAKSYLTMNKVAFKLNPALSVEMNIGLGMEQFKSTRLIQDEKLGLAWGYNLRYNSKSFLFNSRMQQNSSYFPGINQGLQSKYHNLSWITKKAILSLFYQSNKSLVNLFRDTIYNSDLLAFNSNRYGINSNIKLRKTGITLGAGKFNQFGSSGANLNTYTFFDAGLNIRAGKSWSFILNSFNGYGKLENSDDKNIWISNINGGLYHKYFSISGIFTQMPMISQKTSGKVFDRYHKALNITPAINLSLKGKLQTNIGYSLSRSLFDETLTSYVVGRVGYIGKRNGLTVSLNGTVPVKKSNLGMVGHTRENITLSIQKKLNLPIIFKKKYAKLKVMAFEDENGNGIKENDESYLPNIKMKINDIPFYTANSGIVTYKNIHKDTYTIDLTDAGNVEGVYPAKGLFQKVLVKGNSTVHIPFSKSKAITGKILVELDPLSNIKFIPSGLKVIATDSLGNSFAAITNEKGEFQINVPKGKYIVSLNPDAFDEKLKPEIMALKADLIADDEYKIQFLIKQQKRKIRLLNSN